MTSALAAAYAHGPGKQIQVGPPPPWRAVVGPLCPLPRGSALARLILDVLTPSRWEPWNQYNDHRAYPSPRASYLVDVEIVVAGQRWPVEPVRRATVGAHPPPMDRPVRLDFKRRPERLSRGYGEFAHALTELEVGHLSAALVEHAERLGLVAIADANGVSVSGSGGRSAVLPHRSSGVGPRGLSADPRQLPGNSLAAFAGGVRDLPAGLLNHAGLRHTLAVRNVEGCQDGWYTVDPFQLTEPAAAMDILQDLHGHPPAVLDVSGMNLALITTADVGAAVAAEGEDAYHALLRAAGSVAQRVCVKSAEAGMFCRPLRSFDDPALEAAVGSPVSHSLLYVLLAGRPRVTGFSYDLTPLETP
ncbi:MAG: hypothetical protein ABW215_06705 [Kibdelosporangium sp.]